MLLWETRKAATRHNTSCSYIKEKCIKLHVVKAYLPIATLTNSLSIDRDTKKLKTFDCVVSWCSFQSLSQIRNVYYLTCLWDYSWVFSLAFYIGTCKFTCMKIPNRFLTTKYMYMYIICRLIFRLRSTCNQLATT